MSPIAAAAAAAAASAAHFTEKGEAEIDLDETKVCFILSQFKRLLRTEIFI